VRFTADDNQLRPMGRATSGVLGMRFRTGDELLSMEVVGSGSDAYLLTATDAGWGKRTHVEDYRVQAAAAPASAPTGSPRTEGPWSVPSWCTRRTRCFAITSNGTAIRTPVVDVRVTGRDTMGVEARQRRRSGRRRVRGAQRRARR
jgi:DNA gyrase subunit A